MKKFIIAFALAIVSTSSFSADIDVVEKLSRVNQKVIGLTAGQEVLVEDTAAITRGVEANALALNGEAYARRLQDDILRSRVANAQADRMIGDEDLQVQVDENKASGVLTNKAVKEQQGQIDTNRTDLDSQVVRMTKAEKDIYSNTAVAQRNAATDIRQDQQIGAVKKDVAQNKADINNLYTVTEELGYRIDGANAAMHALHNSSVRLINAGDYSVGMGVGFAGSEQALATSVGYAVTETLVVSGSVTITTGHVNDVAGGAGIAKTF